MVMPSTPWAAMRSVAAARMRARWARPVGARRVPTSVPIAAPYPPIAGAVRAPSRRLPCWQLPSASCATVVDQSLDREPGDSRLASVPGVQIPQRFHAGLADGSITLAFRRWRKPAAKAGGRQRTPVGELAIDAVDPVEVDERHRGRRARRPATADRDELLGELARYGHEDGTLYRIALHLAGPDPRVALRERADVTDDEWEAIGARLARLDRAEPPRAVDHHRAAPDLRAPGRPGPRPGRLARAGDAAVQDRRPQAQGDGADREPGGRLPALTPRPRRPRPPRSTDG